MSSFAAGTAPIKAEFIVSTSAPARAADDDAAEGGTAHAGGSTGTDPRDDGGNAGGRKKMNKADKKRGQNKGRRFGKIRDDLDLCWKVASGAACEFASECRFNHDVKAYLDAKPQDLHMPTADEMRNAPPYIVLDDSKPGITPGDKCIIFEEFGECRYGYKCRYLRSHVNIKPDGLPELVVHEEKAAPAVFTYKEMNFIGADVQKLLRTKKYPTPVTDEFLKEMKEKEDQEKVALATKKEAAQQVLEQDLAQTEAEKDTPDVPMRFNEKKRLFWSGKSYLAPLTTVGNLPFRRLCVALGADITCGEMGLATSFLQGSKEEWSLVRRHPSEKTFGIQVAGSKPHTLIPTAEIIGKELAGNVDFVDVNCGCPIDLVFKSGSGSALLDAPGKLGRIVVGMNKALGEIPVTVKLRTGVKDSKNTAHKLMPRLGPEFGASATTLHGRSRQQRYTKLADWDYIKECVEAVRAREEEVGMAPIPIFGGGDCFSAEDYWGAVAKYNVDGVMVARGALIKPWIFTEIKERREWDISSRERLELIRKFAEFGLSHFGTDTAGVTTTRRYLCEALSFQYRYVPIGLLETLPGRINHRAPAYKGRDELETLLASDNSQDWVKISEMFLGPAPESWSFTPKHKSNSYDSQG
ncbi:zinc finger dihydrouridine synthase [Cylindrobasidium torrendii FP15055 ss-10]|uniref:tRNA-dihydrouridine(47) synthase [NAD(P)(+)] n=1 Tax=Cylindrobasidium torrendii FP15055 ss-10 TaxID=1314674 RepID=A0A0D7BR54_9AGAR|nr:zinc finger dihydrouridine synthase [Cylindrobasidium torrendii FP15055 ss-10]